MRSLGASPTIEPFEGGRMYYSFENQGMALVFDDEILTAVQLFAENAEPGMKRYSGPLPFGVRFGSSRTEVIERAGQPTRRHDTPSNGVIEAGPWVKYQREGYSIHFQFNNAGTAVRMCSILYEAKK
jgi:hypothetical protein